MTRVASGRQGAVVFRFGSAPSLAACGAALEGALLRIKQRRQRACRTPRPEAAAVPGSPLARFLDDVLGMTVALGCASDPLVNLFWQRSGVSRLDWGDPDEHSAVADVLQELARRFEATVGAARAQLVAALGEARDFDAVHRLVADGRAVPFTDAIGDGFLLRPDRGASRQALAGLPPLPVLPIAANDARPPCPPAA